VEQGNAISELVALLELSGPAAERAIRIGQRSGVRRRHAAVEPGLVNRMGTAERMEAYRRLAPDLALAAARRALDAAAVEAERVTDLVAVSCTGLSAPGLDADLVRGLGLRRSVRRTFVGFMGCFGAIVGLRTAAAVARSEPGAVVLVVCAELCSLHLRRDPDPQNIVAACLFGDGAAAALVGAAPPGDGAAPAIGRIGRGASRLIEEGASWMSWRITDAGFAMTLSPQVPNGLRRALRGFARGCAGARTPSLLVHPGGPNILRAAAAALGEDAGLEAAAAVLADRGNMSSATVLFVLEEALRRGITLPGLLLAFGPGLTLEGLMLEPPRRPE
jgi:predicted naringenin-chalcone synthase